MNNRLLKERDIMLNSALGAYILLFFIKGYQSDSQSSEKRITIWHLAPVLPLILHQVSRKAILKRRGGLRSILNRDPEMDIAQNEAIFNLEKRIQDMKERFFKSIQYGLMFRIFELNNGYFFSIANISIPKNAGPEVTDILKSAEKLGAWSAKVSVFEYLTILGVRP